MIGKSLVVAAGFAAVLIGAVPVSTRLSAQAPATPAPQLAPTPWRFAGARPCVRPDGGVLQCPAAAGTRAIRAGRLFDSISGQMLTKQIILVAGERITEVGPDGQVRIPPGTPVIDLSGAPVLPGLVDAHSRRYDTRRPGLTVGRRALSAGVSARATLRAGVRAGRDRGGRAHGCGVVDAFGRHTTVLVPFEREFGHERRGSNTSQRRGLCQQRCVEIANACRVGVAGAGKHHR